MPVPALTQEIRAKYIFSPGELKDIGDSLAAKVMNKDEIQDQRKSVMSDFKDRLDRINMEIRSLSNNLVLRYEFRTYRCKVTKDFNKKILKFHDVGTDDLIEERPFKPEDYQEDFIDEEIIAPVAAKKRKK